MVPAAGDAVKEAQTWLKAYGYYSGKLDGVYGDATTKAVRHFQQNNGLTMDGKIGSKTRSILTSGGAVPASAQPAPTEPATANTAAEIKAAQTLLKQYGYIPYDLEPEKETVARGLEYALADWCVARVAERLKRSELQQYFCCDSPRRYAGCRFSSGRTASAAIITESELGIISEIGMPRSINVSKIAVISRMLIAVFYHQ